jgi:hypothetical protein
MAGGLEERLKKAEQNGSFVGRLKGKRAIKEQSARLIQTLWLKRTVERKRVKERNEMCVSRVDNSSGATYYYNFSDKSSSWARPGSTPGGPKPRQPMLKPAGVDLAACRPQSAARWEPKPPGLPRGSRRRPPLLKPARFIFTQQQLAASPDCFNTGLKTYQLQMAKYSRDLPPRASLAGRIKQTDYISSHRPDSTNN